VQPNGRIVVTANVANGAGGWLVRRYMPDGAPDASFGVAGEVGLFPNPGFYDSSPTVTIQDDGKLVLAGQRSLHAALARLDSAGALDPSFGVGGGRIINYGGGYEYFGPVRLQPDGKLLTTLFSTFGSANGAFAFARFNDDGSDDTGFGGGDGLVSFRVTPAGQQTSDVALLPDGRILMTGVSHYDIPQRNFIAYRFNSDGSLDGSFGNGGGVAYDLAGGADDESRSIVLLPTGQFLLVGQIEPPGPSSVQVGAARFDADGTLDTTFGTAGVAVATVDDFSQQTAPSVLPTATSSFELELPRKRASGISTSGSRCAGRATSSAPAGRASGRRRRVASSPPRHSSSIAIRDFGTIDSTGSEWAARERDQLDRLRQPERRVAAPPLHVHRLERQSLAAVADVRRRRRPVRERPVLEGPRRGRPRRLEAEGSTGQQRRRDPAHPEAREHGEGQAHGEGRPPPDARSADRGNPARPAPVREREVLGGELRRPDAQYGHRLQGAELIAVRPSHH
jgi:uncharacterized delta-60 repeat protein